MPMYEFQCLDCEAKFAVKRSFAHANGPADCPECASHHTRKRLTSVAVISNSTRPIPVPMSDGGGCGCGGACACQN